MRLTIGRRMGLGFGVLLGLMAISAIAVLFHLDNMHRQFSFVIQHDAPVIANARHLLTLVVDMETGQRGFVITGADEFLEPYERAVASFEGLLNKEKALVSDDPTQVKLLAKIGASVREWQEKAAAPEIAMRRKVGEATVDARRLQEILSQGVGRRLMDKLMALGHEIEVAFSARGDWEGAFAVKLIEKCMADREYGQRGFLITGQEEFLDKYHYGEQKKLPEYFAKLRSLVSDRGRSSELAARVDRLETLTVEWNRRAAEPEIGARRNMNDHPESLSDVAALLEMGTGKRILDRIRRDFGTFIEEEERLTASRFADASQASHSTTSTTIVLALVSMFLGGVIATKIKRSITNPIRRLAGALGMVAKGDLSQKIEIKSEDEIGEVSRSFNRMVGDLSRLEEERKQGEQALRRAKEYADNIIRSMINMLVVIKPDGRIVTANEATCRMLGYREEELIGRPASLLFCEGEGQPEAETEEDSTTHLIISQEALPFTRTVLRRLVQDGAISNIEKSLLCKSGHTIPTLLSGSVMRDDDGTIRGIVCVAQDITERKQVEEALRDSELRSRTLLQGSPVCNKIIDLDSRLLFMSAAGVAQLKIADIQPFYGRPYPPELYPESMRAPLIEHLERAKAGEISSVECPVLDTEGNELWYHTTFVPACDDEGRIQFIIGASVDITERKRAEDDLQRAKEAADAANSSKSEFLANMSHEIRTPMTAILGFAENLLEENQSESQKLNAIHTIRRNGNNLLRIINDILDVSKIEAGKMGVERIACEPCRIIAEVASLMRVRTEVRKLPLEIEYIGSIPETITTDPTRVRQILVNLVGNAIKFTEKGAVRLQIRFVNDTGEPRLQFDIVDTGRGMTEEQVARLFQPFTQADASTTREFGGTGLGLTISKRFAEMLGGDISVVETEVGGGTTVRATIATGALEGIRMLKDPKAAAVVAEGPHTGAHFEQSSLEGCRILLAEDGPDNQLLISSFLTKAGALVTIEDNGKLAVEKALAAMNRRRKGDPERPFDIILMDMQMPVMDGYEATSLLRQEGYTAPIIALTAHAMATDRKKCINAGCDDYATKPIGRAELLATIRRHLVPADAALSAVP